MSNELTCPGQAVAEAPGGTRSFSIEIRGGRTGFRRRPVLGDRFLIGSDPVCDLRVDDRLAAPLHCLLRRDGDVLEVERMTAAPIFVDGAPVDHATVSDGEMLTIGPVRLVIHAHAMRFDVVRPPDENADLPSSTRRLARRNAARTAAEVVDLLEVEQDRVREFDKRREAGAAALLGELRRTKRPATEALAAVPLAATDALLTRLNRLATAVEQQASRPIRDEHDLRDAADRLLSAQRELLGQADRLFRLAGRLAEAEQANPRHAA